MDMQGVIEKAKELLVQGGVLIIVGIVKPSGIFDYLIEGFRIIPSLFISQMNRMQTSEERNIAIEEDAVFYQEYDKLLQFLTQKGKQIIIFGMPFINLMYFPHDILLRRNKMIEELADKYHFPYIDAYQLQKNAPDSRLYTWKFSFHIRVLDATIMTIFPSSKDWFTKTRGLTTSVDSTHFNSATAFILAKEIEKKIVEIGNRK